jgi:hypothetical protein
MKARRADELIIIIIININIIFITHQEQRQPMGRQIA